MEIAELILRFVRKWFELLMKSLIHNLEDPSP